MSDAAAPTKKVYAAISAVAKDMAEQGISKDRRNQQQGFNFRGIDQVYNALAPALVRNGLLILPRMTERTVTERVTPKGTMLFYVVVKAEFDFVSVEDGSVTTVETYGEAMDSGDKATNKAMSIAYKYAAFQTFCIPTEETAIDPDAEIHTVASGQQHQGGQQQRNNQQRQQGGQRNQQRQQQNQSGGNNQKTFNYERFFTYLNGELAKANTKGQAKDVVSKARNSLSKFSLSDKQIEGYQSEIHQAYLKRLEAANQANQTQQAA